MGSWAVTHSETLLKWSLSGKKGKRIGMVSDGPGRHTVRI